MIIKIHVSKRFSFEWQKYGPLTAYSKYHMVIFIIESSFNIQDNYYIIGLSLYSFTDLTVVWVYRENVDYDTFVSIQQQQVAEKGEKIENKW